MNLITREELAKFMHEAYEQRSKDFNWTTQESCKVEFESLPIENKRVMLTVASDIIILFKLLEQNKERFNKEDER